MLVRDGVRAGSLASFVLRQYVAELFHGERLEFGEVVRPVEMGALTLRLRDSMKSRLR